MGNAQARGLAQPESLLSELSDVVYKDSLGGGRFFKSSLCVHDEGGLVVVKTYAKRPDSPDVKPYEDRLVEIRDALAGVEAPHVWPAQRVYHSDRAVYLVRQYLFSSLAARATTRPFLTRPDKLWLAYQLLVGVAQAHEAGVCHGDIKAENVLVTSWEWAMLADFAPYKPTLLPADNPADFSFFFDTGGRRKCCLAPERFYDPGPDDPSPAVARAAPLTPAMDVFAAGCVLAELFADGKPLFDYSRLLEYRRGAGGPAAAVAALGPGLRELVGHMVQREPGARRTARQYLHWLAEVAMDAAVPAVVHPLMAGLLRLAPDARAVAVADAYCGVRDRLERGKGPAAESPPPPPPAGAAAAAAAGTVMPEGAEAVAVGGPPPEAAGPHVRLPRRQQVPLQGEAAALIAEVQAVLKRVNAAGAASSGAASRRGNATAQAPPGSSAAQPCTALAPLTASQRDASQRDASADTRHADAAPERTNDGLVLVAVLLCSLLRGCRLQQVKVRLLGLLADCAARCGDDDTRLQRALPHLVAAAAEPNAEAAVRCAALRAIPALLASVRALPAGEARVFGEYLFPSLSLLPAEGEAAVLAEFAAVVGPMAQLARTFLEGLQRAGGDEAQGRAAPLINFDHEAAKLRAGIERFVLDLLVGPRPEPKLALLPHLGQLTAALGRRDTANHLLPALLTLFNSREWQVRAALYQHLAGVWPALGPEGVSFALFPFLDRLLADPEPDAVAEAAGLLAALCALGLLRQHHMLAATHKLCDAQLLRSRSTAVRAAAVRFVAVAAAQMTPSAVQALLLPLVLPHLVHEPLSLAAPDCLVGALDGGYALRLSSGGRRLPRPRAATPSTPLSSSPPPTPPPPLSPSYSLILEPGRLRAGASRLAAALEQSAAAAAAGAALELVARARRSVTLPSALGDAAVRPQPPAPARGEGSGGAAGEGAADEAAAEPWYPRGVLVAHLAEHTKPLTRLASCPGSPFFVSASADGTAKVWDCRRLERDISFRSRLTYAAHTGAVTAAAALLDGCQVATGGSEGGVHVWRVERAPRSGDRFGGIVGVQQIDPGQGSVLDLAVWGPDVVAASLQRGGVAGWDLRAPSAAAGAAAWMLAVPPSEGTVGRFCCDPGNGRSWVVTGTSRGAMCLWDLRFLLPVNRWRHPTGAWVSAMALAIAPPWCLGLGHGAKTAGPLVFVAAGEGEVALWDVGDGSCREVLRVLRRDAPESVRRAPPAALTAPPPAPRGVDVMGRAKQLGVGDLQSPPPRKEGFRALLPTPGGQLLTGGTDRVVRCWDCGRPQNSYTMAAPPPLPPPPPAGDAHGTVPVDMPRYTYASRSVLGVPVVEETSAVERFEAPAGGDRDPHMARLAWSERAAALCHEQTIVDAAQVAGAAEALLVTAGLDGVVKVWR